MKSFKLFLKEDEVKDIQFMGDWESPVLQNISPDSVGFYDTKTRKGLKGAVPNIIKYFSKLDADFVFYFIRDAEAQNLSEVEEGWSPPNHPLFIHYGIKPDPDAITVVFTNNAAADLVPIHKPGNLAHRLSHSLGRDSRNSNTPYQGYHPEFSAVIDSVMAMLTDMDWDVNLLGPNGKIKRNILLFGPEDTENSLEYNSLNAYFRAVAPTFHASKAPKGYRNGFEFTHELFSNYVKNGGKVELSDFDKIYIPPAKFTPNDEEYYDIMLDYQEYPTGADGEPDYDQEPVLDEEGFQKALTEPTIMSRDEFKDFSSGTWERTYEIYFDGLLNSLEGEMFIM